MKYRKIKKQLTKEEAKNELQKALCNIENLEESIYTWLNEKPTGIIACVIATEFGNLENAIQNNRNKIAWNLERINDLKRFL